MQNANIFYVAPGHKCIYRGRIYMHGSDEPEMILQHSGYRNMMPLPVIMCTPLPFLAFKARPC